MWPERKDKLLNKILNDPDLGSFGIAYKIYIL